jgi:hydroxymethylpyrimidine pyrophosphatase-like HAD family hydrolase
VIDSTISGTLLAFDVDGTLVREDGTVGPATVDALDAARLAGATLTLATGRDWDAVEGLLAELKPIQFALCINGIEVIDATGRLLHAEELDADVAATAIKTLRDAVPGIAFGLGIGGRLVGEPALAGLLPPGAGQIAEVIDVVDELGPKLRDVVVFHPDHTEDLAGLHRRCRHVLPPEGLDIAFSGLPMLELVPPGAGKDKGLAWLATHLGIPNDRVVAFGDGLNDLAMLRWAGTGVAMGQADEAVKAAADEVTDTVGADGVAAWIHNHLPE